MLFSVSFLIYCRIMFDLDIIVLMKGFSLRLLFPSQKESHPVPNLIFWTPVLWSVLYKITVLYLSFCLSISSSAFLSGMSCLFFQISAPWQVIGIFKYCQSPFFQENSFFPKFWQKQLKMTPKQFFLDFLKNFVISFPGSNLE